MATTVTTYPYPGTTPKTQHLTEGGKVWVQGYEFIVKNLRIPDARDGSIARFKGVCTSNPVNDPIRHTSTMGEAMAGIRGFIRGMIRG